MLKQVVPLILLALSGCTLLILLALSWWSASARSDYGYSLVEPEKTADKYIALLVAAEDLPVFYISST